MNPYLVSGGVKTGEEMPLAKCPETEGIKLYEVIGTSYAENAVTRNFPAVKNSLGRGNAKFISSIESPVRMVQFYDWSAHHVLYHGGGLDNKWSLKIHSNKGIYTTAFVDGHVKSKVYYQPRLLYSDDFTWDNGR